MFNQIYKLFQSNINKIPLEDYVTEIFVGILNQDDEIKYQFCQLLNLPEDDYSITTQECYKLQGKMDCRIDIQIMGKNVICFIENKVNSKEGFEQLDRYAEVLEQHQHLKKRLVYLTKFSDVKVRSEPYFLQKRWYQVADFLQQFKQSNVVRDFLSFLNKQQMAHNVSLLPEDYEILKRINDVVSKSYSHLERVSDKFNEIFYYDTKKFLNRSLTTNDVTTHKRLVYLCKNIVNDNGESDLKYGFQLCQPNIYVSIWLDNKNTKYYEDFYNVAKSLSAPFVLDEVPNKGIAIELKQDISLFQNDENADTIISNWFEESFNMLAGTVKSMDSISWDFNISPKI